MATDTLSSVFSALADPTRRAILANLMKGPKPMGEIAKPFAMTGPAISKHLRVLEKAGLIKTDRKAQLRPRSLDAARLKEVQDFNQPYPKFVEESFERLDALLEELQKEENQ